MIETFKYEDKNLEDALKKVLVGINAEKEDIFYKTREIEGKLFKSKKIEIIAVKKEDIIKYIKEYLNNISKLTNIDIKSEVKEKDEVIYITLVTSNNAIIIGKDGRTLNALQLVLRQSLKIRIDFNIKINLDVSNYKNNKMKNIEQVVRKISKEVLESKIDAKLDSMNSYERRFVHTIVSEYSDLSTESEGEEPNRYVIIRYNK